MPFPRLLHPVPVELESLDRAATIVDDDYGEPVQQAVRSPRHVLSGQVSWGKGDQQFRLGPLGAEEHADGYVLFLLKDLRAANLELKQGDRIVAIGAGVARIELDVYVVKLKPEGHYAWAGGPTMMKAFFADRFPAKQKRGGYAG